MIYQSPSSDRLQRVHLPTLVAQAQQAADTARVRTRTERPSSDRELMTECAVRCRAGLPIPRDAGRDI